mgnify:CR=1 FL=1
MGERRPYVVTFIGDMNILSALVWLIVTILYLLEIPGVIIKSSYGFLSGATQLFLSIALLVISFGYLRLKRWGYWLLLTINICFLIVTIISLLQGKQQSLNLGIINAVISLLFIMPTRKYFSKDNPTT